MKLRIEPGIKILQLIDNASEGNFITIVVFNKRRKQLIAKMRAIKPLVPGSKEKKFWRLIRPRRSQNLLGVRVTKTEREFEDKRVKYKNQSESFTTDFKCHQRLNFRRNKFYNFYSSTPIFKEEDLEGGDL